MIQFQFFPRSVGLTQPIAEVVECFHTVAKDIASPENNLSSDGVLRVIRPHLEKLGYRVEGGKNRDQKIKVPVLFGLNNTIDKFYDIGAAYDLWQATYKDELSTYNWGPQEVEVEVNAASQVSMS
jgi:hypothetical protein